MTNATPQIVGVFEQVVELHEGDDAEPAGDEQRTEVRESS